MEFYKPKVIISRCLNFAPCRYDGQMVKDPFLSLLIPYVDFITVCPEEEIGLGTPRETIRLIKKEDQIHLMQNKTEIDLTNKMSSFSENYVKRLNFIQGFIFKSKSPSCGLKDAKVYLKMGKAQSVGKQNGLFTDVIVNQFPLLPITDEGRLNDFHIREHFLTRIFLLAHFDEVSRSQSVESLKEFHHKHHMLLMSLNQAGLKRLERIMNNKDLDKDEKFNSYYDTLLEATKRMANVRSKCHVFNYYFGQLADQLSSKEQQFVLEQLEHYKNGHIPYSSLLILLKSLALRYDEMDLLSQSYFNPYPDQLLQLRDSGKHII